MGVASPSVHPPGGELLLALRRAQSRGRLAHAYLLLGPAGVGKRLLACRLARQIVCPDTAPENCACLACTLSEERLREGRHPGIHILSAPEGKAQIPVEVLREELLQAIQLRSFQGQRQVFVVEEAHRLGPEAQNAILKTLEEPGKDMFILLTASSAQSLLPTVRSRCQRLYLSPPEALHGEQGAGDPAGRMCGGFCSLPDQESREEALEGREGLLAWLEQGAEAFQLVDLLVPEGTTSGVEGQDRVCTRLDLLGTLMRDALVLHGEGNLGDLVHADVEASLRRIARRLGAALVPGLEAVVEARRGIRAYVDPSLVCLRLADRLQ